jgi:hypothetical protein
MTLDGSYHYHSLENDLAIILVSLARLRMINDAIHPLIVIWRAIFGYIFTGGLFL